MSLTKTGARLVRVIKYRVFLRLVSSLVIFSTFTVSLPAAPSTIVGTANRTWQEARLAFLSAGITEKLPIGLAAFFKASWRKSSTTGDISQIRIFPGPLTISQGQETVLSAVAYDSNDEPLSGIPFEWSVTDVGRQRAPKRLLTSTYKPSIPGTFKITVHALGHEAEIPVTVTRFTGNQVPGRPAFSISSLTGRRPIQSATKEKDGTVQDITPRGVDAPAQLLPGDGWTDTNWESADDPTNQTGNPPGGPSDGGAGSGNFQLSAPVVSLPGRGIDLALNLNYNSRLWNKSGSELKFDIDKGAPAPGWSLGFGKIVYMGEGGCMLVDADGTRHSYTGSMPPPYPSGMSFTGHTTDGSLIDYGCQFTYGVYGSSWAKLSNGTSISYSTIGNTPDQTYPTTITDAQGNYITITYRNPENPQIETVTDTLGRVVTFQYDSLDRLISVSVPRSNDEDPIYGSTKSRIAMRIHYRPLTLNYSFGTGITPVVRNGTPWVIDSIYYPGTNTGYWFGGADPQDSDYADSYSSYGMITKVTEQRGMSWTPTSEAQGTIAPGVMTKRAEYNYPLTPANTTGRTSGVSLTDAPTYTRLAESWDGRDVAEDAVTTYSVNESDWRWDGFNNSPSRTITVTQPSGAISKQYTYRSGLWNEGLVFADETIVMNGSTATVVASSLVAWEQGSLADVTYGAPRPNWIERTDENGHKVKTDYSYTGGKFNQITGSCDYDNASVLLSCSSSSYENSAPYTGQFDQYGKFVSGRHIFNLVTNAGIHNPAGTRVSYTEYEYDNYTAQPFTDAPGVIQHALSHNKFYTGTQDGPNCSNGEWNNNQCTYEGEIVYTTPWPTEVVCHFECYDYEQIPVYDSATNKRGNVTKVTTYADAQNLAGAVIETRGYDITGNVVKSSSACCEETTILYDDPTTVGIIDTQYAYPISQTRGAASASSPHRITTSATYSFNTGQIKSTTDANGLTSTNWYNPDTLRPVKSISSTGAYATTAYDDAAMTITEEVREFGGTLASKSTKFLNGVGLTRKVESFGPNSIVDISETKYTKLGEEWKQSRPYRAGETVYWSEKFYDAQGRLTKIVEPDGSETKAFYNEASLPDSVVSQPGNRIRVVDAWGRERWGRYDQQGRLAQVVEPNPDGALNPSGSVFTSGSLLTKYSYDTLGRPVETAQGARLNEAATQFRKFKYDDLGRLTRQKLAEQTATLNDAGQFVGPGQAGANWSEAFTFDNRSNITLKTDPRGVRTYFSYQLTGGGDDPLNRLQSRWYDLSGPLDPSSPIHVASGVSYEYETAGDKTRIKKIRTDGVLTEDFIYDSESRVSEYKQTVDYRTTRPMTVNYLYDSLDRVKEVTYPAQYGIAGDPRKIVAHSYDTASRLTNITFGGQQQAGDIVYNASDQTTAIKIGVAGANQVTENYTFDPQTGLLTNQKAIRNGSSLLDLSYEYNRGGSSGSLNGKTGHLTKIVDNLNTNKNREYEFDAVGRLTKAKGGANGTLWSQTYSYDRFGNRTIVAASGVAADGSTIPRDGIPNLTYNNTSNRITTAGWEYDSAGNQTRALAADAVTWLKFEYDAANRIRVVKRDDASQTMVQAFMYGSTNARLIDYDAGAGVNKLLASVGGTTLSEYTEFQHTVPTWTKTYTYLGDTHLATVTPNGAGGETTEFNHPDRLGTRTITNQQTGGNAEQAHLPFGTALNAESSVPSNNRRFTSYERSSQTGLDYAVNRTYDSKQGRFTQVDPIGMQAASLVAPQTLNLYTYCGNDPVNHTDPFGLFFGSLFKWIWKAVRIIAAVVFAALAVLAFSMGQVWAGIALGATSASIVADLLNLKGLQKIIAILSVAVSVARLRLSLNPTPPIFGLLGGSGSGGGIETEILSVFTNVGAISSSLIPKKRKKNLTPKQILDTTLGIVSTALNKPGCREYITENKQTSILSNDPRETLKKMVKGRDGHRIINEGRSDPSNANTAAQGGIDNELDPETFTLRQMPTIRLWKPFFSDKLNPNLQTAMSGIYRKKALAILHEMKHVYSGNAPASHDQPGGWNDAILEKCF